MLRIPYKQVPRTFKAGSSAAAVAIAALLLSSSHNCIVLDFSILYRQGATIKEGCSAAAVAIAAVP
jgi:hypothetical protein